MKKIFVLILFISQLAFSQEEIEKFIEDVEKNNFIDPKKDYLAEELFSKIKDIKPFKEEWIKNFLEDLDVKYMPIKF